MKIIHSIFNLQAVRDRITFVHISKLHYLENYIYYKLVMSPSFYILRLLENDKK